MNAALSAAADLIEDGGWCKRLWAVDQAGRYCDPESGAAVAWCPIGALRRVGCCREDEVAAARALARSLGLDGQDPLLEIARWNDAEGRTEAQVVSAMREAV